MAKDRYPWWLRPIPIGGTLFVELHTGTDPHLVINREGGGLVRVELNEVRHLSAALALAGGELAALASEVKDNER